VSPSRTWPDSDVEIADDTDAEVASADVSEIPWTPVVSEACDDNALAAVASAADWTLAWLEPECVVSTVGLAQVPPSSPPGDVPTTISADRSPDAVPTK